MTEDAATQKRNLLQALVIFLIALLLSVTIGESVVGKLLAHWTLDRFIRWEAPTVDDHIVLIDITEEDYAQIFGRKRPLDPPKIIELVRAAYDGGARAIAVDISTADWPEKSEEFISRIPSDAAIVWARGFYLDNQSAKPRTVLEPLLGGGTAAENECYGVPALGQEAGIVRYFYSGLEIDQWEPSFVDQIVYRSQHDSCMPRKDGSEELRIIDFSARIHPESAYTLLLESRQKGWSERKQYAGKIVILGGSFHSGSDTALTPIGARSGLEIIGQAVSSVTRGNLRRELGRQWSVLIDGCIGLLLFAVGLLGDRVQLAATFVLALLLAYFSLYVFRQYYLFVSFIPFLIGVAAHVFLGRMHSRS